jgi:hypothetical protein
MKARCLNPNHKQYRDYGGRGITVCDRWTSATDGFWNFVKDMGEYKENSTIERIDNEGNYEPGNCVWASRSQQNLNQRLRHDNQVGIRGISRRRGKFRVTIWIGGKQIHGGDFAELSEARHKLELLREEHTR